MLVAHLYVAAVGYAAAEVRHAFRWNVSLRCVKQLKIEDVTWLHGLTSVFFVASIQSYEPGIKVKLHGRTRLDTFAQRDDLFRSSI